MCPTVGTMPPHLHKKFSAESFHTPLALAVPLWHPLPRMHRSQSGSGLLSGQIAVYLLIDKGFSTTGAARFEAGFPSAVAGGKMVGHSSAPCGTPHPLHPSEPALETPLLNAALRQNHFKPGAPCVIYFVHHTVTCKLEIVT